jgi:hypothetical protein
VYATIVLGNQTPRQRAGGFISKDFTIEFFGTRILCGELPKTWFLPIMAI